MEKLFTDTSPEAEAVLIELLRAMPSWRKLQMMNRLNCRLRTLAMSGLRQRFPDATDEELFWRLAELRLGSVLATRVYGPPPCKVTTDG